MFNTHTIQTNINIKETAQYYFNTSASLMWTNCLANFQSLFNVCERQQDSKKKSLLSFC